MEIWSILGDVGMTGMRIWDMETVASESILEESLNPEEERKTKGKAEPKRLDLRWSRGSLCSYIIPKPMSLSIMTQIYYTYIMFRGMFCGNTRSPGTTSMTWVEGHRWDEVHLRPPRHPYRRPAAKAKKARRGKTWQDHPAWDPVISL